MMNASFSVLLQMVCMIKHIVSGAIRSRHGSNYSPQLWSIIFMIEDEMCVNTVILQLQHQDYVQAPYLSTLKNFGSRRLVSIFRCGCHGLHVDTGQFKPVEQRVDREQRFCPVCATDTAEDEHHFVLDCPEYCSIRERFTAIFWGSAPTLSSFFTLHDHKVIAKFLHEFFTHRSMLLEGVLGVPQH